MSRIRVDELINQGNSGPTLAVEGLRVPSTKSLVVEGIISLNGDTGLTGQVLSRTTTGVGWTNVPLTDNNTTYTLSTVDGANPATDKVIRLSAGGSGSGFTDVVLVAGNNVSLTRNAGRIIIDSSFTDTNTITRIGSGGQNYTDGDINLIGTGAATIIQSGRTFTINVNDDDTTYTGESGVTVTTDNKIKIGQPVGPTDPVTFQQVTVSGDLIVQGTTTTSNSVTVTTLDKFINLNDVLIPTDAVADGGGIRLKGDSNHTILWSNTDDSWTSSEHFNLASGRNYLIDGDEVITSTALGNNVRQSTLESVGVLSSGRWEAQTIGIAYGGTGQTNANAALNAFLPSQAGNASKYLLTDGQDTSWSAIPPTYNGWSIGDSSVTAQVNSNDIVRVIGTGSALVTMDNVQKRLTINADNTTYNLSVENQQQPNRKSIRLTDSTGYAEEIVLSAGTGVTLTRTGTRLEFSVAQDLSTSAAPTFTNLTITGGVNATTYTGSAAQLESLTGVPNGVYGSSAVIPVISVDPSGRITNISTAPNTGAAGAGGIVAGGNDYSIQYNNNGGLAGSDKIKFEPIQGELTLKGYLVSDNIVSTGATITELQALDYIKFPSKNTSERDYLNVLNGSVIYNNVDDQLQMYQDGQWLPVGGVRNIGDLLDVDLSTPPGDGQILSYSATGGRWVPTTVTTSGNVQQNSSLFVQNNTVPLASGNLSFNSATNVLTYTPPDITSFITAETDPLFTASPSSGIQLSHITNWTQAYNWGDHSAIGYLQATNTEKANWNEAYSWGNHASAGYLTAEVDTLDSVTGRGSTTINNITVGRLTAGGLTYPNANGTIGQVLTSDGSGNVTWQNTSSGSGGGAQQLTQLTDVSLTTPTSGQVLYFNGTTWTNGVGSGGSGSSTLLGLTDTPASMGTAGQILAVNSGGTALEFVTSSASGGANVTISDNPPSNPNSGDLWWESDAGRLKIRYSSVWVDANPAGGTSGSGGSYADGDVDSHLNKGTATTGQVLGWNGTDYAWVASSATDTDTTYTAGTGITLTGTVFSLDTTSSPTFAGLTLNGSATPLTDGTYDLGSTSNRWRYLYTDNLVAGGVTYPTTNGNSGEVLTSDGAGNITWSAVSGGGGGGAEVDTLDSVTNRGGTTTNDINVGGVLATGLKLNVNTSTTNYGSVSGTIGDIKRINEHPHYYDGTTWRPFYLSGTPITAATSDVHFDDVQVRMDFEDDGSGAIHPFINHVNKLQINGTGTSGITIVNTPVKFGTSSLKLNQGVAYAAWTENYTEVQFIDREVVQATNGDYGAGKRGGCIDWTQDWTIETWVYFPTGMSDGQQPLICAQVGTGTGQGISFNSPTSGSPGAGNTYLQWANGDLGQAADQSSLAYWTKVYDTWIHVAVSFRASDATLHAHVNGTESTSGSYGTVIDNSVHSNTGGFTFLGFYRHGTGGYSTGGTGYYIDDLRITQAFRYGSNSIGGAVTSFTAPTSAYPITDQLPPTVDPDWSSVKLRATFDTSIDEIGPDTLTGYVVNGNPIIQGPVKYGTGAAYPRVNAANTGIQWTSGDYSFLTGEWTFESWVKFNSFPLWTNSPSGSKYQVLWSHGSNTGTTSNNIEFGVQLWSSTDDQFRFYWKDSDGFVALSAVGDVFTLDDIQRWQHIALTKNSNNELQLFVNGYALRDDNTDSDITTGKQISALTLNSGTSGSLGEFSLGGRSGSYTFSSATDQSEIYFDDFRFSDIVRYTDTFSPPSGPLPTTGTASNNPPGTPTTGGLTYPTSNGTNGQVLTSNGSGTVTWTTISGGAEVDTLDTVTGRGSITTNDIEVGRIHANGLLATGPTAGDAATGTYVSMVSSLNQSSSYRDMKLQSTTGGGTQTMMTLEASSNTVTVRNCVVETRLTTDDIELFGQDGVAGASQLQLKIYHDSSGGNDTIIEKSGNGNLSLKANQLFVKSSDASEFLLTATENNSVDLYYDGVKKLETTSAGATITGSLQVSSSITSNFGITIPTGQGITLGTGGIFIAASQTVLGTTYTDFLPTGGQDVRHWSDSSNIGIVLKNSAGAELHYQNNKKLETTSAGVTITGDATITGSLQANSITTSATAVEEAVVGTITFTANGASNYTFTGTGYPIATAQTTDLNMHVGLKYKIINTAGSSHPLEFRSGGVVHPGYAAGWITGSKTGTQYITIPYSILLGQNVPQTFEYACTLHPTNMNGTVRFAFF